jgi:hypothetical protein
MIAKEYNMIRQFSDAECANMFYVEKNGKKVRLAKIKKQSKRAMPFADSIKSGITEHEPGTAGRVADLAKFYQSHMVESADGNWELNDDVSAFNV